MQKNKEDNNLKIMLGIFFLVLIWSAITPHAFLGWLMEAAPPLIMVLVLALTYKKFRFSNFVYFIVLIHTIILLIGAKYTYAGNPLFQYFKETWDLNRNYYDRVGHFAQGFTPAIIAKEFLLRKGYLKRSKMFYYILFSIVLAISAAWELMEFSYSLITGISGDVILSTQGVLWDTQWDMVMALLGAVTSLVIFRKIHDRYIMKIIKAVKVV